MSHAVIEQNGTLVNDASHAKLGNCHTQQQLIEIGCS